MSRKYGVIGYSAVGTNCTVLNLSSATTIRPKIYDVIVGCAATPGDGASRFQLVRTTAVGSGGSTANIVALDPGDPVSLASAKQNYAGSNEPTYTSNTELAGFSVNQRNTFRWVAAPGGELVLPATAANGIGLKSLSAAGTTAQHEATFFFEE